MGYLLAALCLSTCVTSCFAFSFPGPETDGTGQNCVQAADGAGGPKCKSPKIGVCCDAYRSSINCLTASGSSCASYGPAGNTPLTAYCCDQLDLPSSACKPVRSASECESQDVQVYPNGNEYLVCCAKIDPVGVRRSNQTYYGGLDCQNATSAARLAGCSGEGKTRTKLFCCS